MPTSANFEGLRRERKRRRTRGRRCQRVALWAFGSGCVTDPSVRSGVRRIVVEPRTERQTARSTAKRPKEPIGPPARFRRCKHLRLGSVEPRSVVVAADASTCDDAFGPSWPLRAEPTVRARWRVWLWAYPRTSDRTGAFGARCPRSVHGAGGEQGAVGGRAVGVGVERPGGRARRGIRPAVGEPSDGARRQAAGGPTSGRGHGNARRNRRSSAESPRASSSGLKAPAHRPLRAKSTMTCPAGPWLPAYPRPSRLGGRNQGGCPPPVHVAAETSGLVRGSRAQRNARRNQSVRWPVSADASTCDSVPSNPGP